MRILLLLSAFLALIGPTGATVAAAQSRTAACAIQRVAAMPVRAHDVVLVTTDRAIYRGAAPIVPASAQARLMPVVHYAMRLRV